MFVLDDYAFSVGESVLIATTHPDPSGTDEEYSGVDDGSGDIVVEIDDGDTSSDDTEDDDSEDIEGSEDTEGFGNTDITESAILSDIYEVMVVQSYLSVVIAFGVFLACGVLIGKVFWERLK